MRLITNEELAIVAGGEEDEGGEEYHSGGDYSGGGDGGGGGAPDSPVKVDLSFLNNIKINVAPATPAINPYTNAPLCGPGQTATDIKYEASGATTTTGASYDSQSGFKANIGGTSSTWKVTNGCTQ